MEDKRALLDPGTPLSDGRATIGRWLPRLLASRVVRVLGVLLVAAGAFTFMNAPPARPPYSTAGDADMLTQWGFKALWSLITLIGARNVVRTCQFVLPAYKDAFAYSEHSTKNSRYVALSIDDGLIRPWRKPAREYALVDEVRALLSRYSARATFFPISSGLMDGTAAVANLLADGHEIGCHMATMWGSPPFSQMPPARFEVELRASIGTLEAAMAGAARVAPNRTRVRWFRPPQGRISESMHATVTKLGLRVALMDAYVDDWAISDARWNARTVLRQTQPGSLIIIHMPERGYREWILAQLEQLLEGLTARGLRCVTVSELESLSRGSNDQ